MALKTKMTEALKKAAPGKQHSVPPKGQQIGSSQSKNQVVAPGPKPIIAKPGVRADLRTVAESKKNPTGQIAPPVEPIPKETVTTSAFEALMPLVSGDPNLVIATRKELGVTQEVFARLI